jgi:hypothetical protein
MGSICGGMMGSQPSSGGQQPAPGSTPNQPTPGSTPYQPSQPNFYGGMGGYGPPYGGYGGYGGYNGYGGYAPPYGGGFGTPYGGGYGMGYGGMGGYGGSVFGGPMGGYGNGYSSNMMYQQLMPLLNSLLGARMQQPQLQQPTQQQQQPQLQQPQTYQDYMNNFNAAHSGPVATDDMPMTQDQWNAARQYPMQQQPAPSSLGPMLGAPNGPSPDALPYAPQSAGWSPVDAPGSYEYA